MVPIRMALGDLRTSLLLSCHHHLLALFLLYILQNYSDGKNTSSSDGPVKVSIFGRQATTTGDCHSPGRIFATKSNDHFTSQYVLATFT